MLKKLRRRLATIFTIFTGAVLAAALAASFAQLAAQTRQNHKLLFASTVDQMTITLLGVDPARQVQTSLYTGEAIVYAKIDGQVLETIAAAPLSPQQQEEMFLAAKGVATARDFTVWDGSVYHSYTMQVTPNTAPANSADVVVADDSYSISMAVSPALDTSGIFELRYGGASYQAKYFNFAAQTASGQPIRTYEAAVLENLDAQNREILLDGLRYLLILAAGLALLFLANWTLAKLLLRSTEEGLRRQTEFVAAASHELRSPLAVIRASLSAAKEAADSEEPRQAEKFGTAALDEAERMGHLVDDLLVLAGGDAGSWQLHTAPVDLDTLLIDAAESYTPLAKQKGLRLELKLPDETLPQPSGDAERLRQILAILLDNALQYAPEGTSITLSAAAKKGKLRIAVQDRGPGIPDEEKQRVFERFYRSDKSRHSKAHFGLGLAVAQELAQLHKGQLSISNTEGGGATFTLVLPLG